MLINSTDFYSNYQVNYYDYKQLSLKYLLNNYQNLKLNERILNYSDNDFLRTIKSDIRQTYLHSIETVFDLIYSLTPKKNGTISERHILETISKGTFHYDKISKIATEKDQALKFLDDEVTFSDGNKTSLIHFLFYRGSVMTTEIEDSLTAIKHCLILLANDFSDRDEYNSYKHTLKIFPNFDQFKLKSIDTDSINSTFDVSDSVTFFRKDKKTGKETLVTKVFDTERDLKMTSISSDLIWNIIMPRKLIFSKKERTSNEIELVLFLMKDIKEKSNRNIKVNDLKLTFEPE
ncbi:hypothetical protein ACE01N_20225 [Saccharicrinis sp. FJH2]|uniref:hypothetical protein n=1 Tax=Saccharicrinis sp. FJH65 TaxID=3344659 RepID=UPI0035F297E9